MLTLAPVTGPVVPMASEWIPLCKALSRKREVVAIAGLTGRSRQEVVGWLFEFWCWVDQETADGKIPGLGPENLVEVVGADLAFWRAVESVGWLGIEGADLTIPNFERWLGRSSKKRIAAAERQRRHRGTDYQTKKQDHVLSRSGCDKNVTTEQNRTEQGEESPSTPLARSSAGADSGPGGKEESSDLEGHSAPAERPDATAAPGGQARKPATALPAAPGTPGPPANVDPVVLMFPTVGRGASEWHLCRSKVDEYAESFPGVDVLLECRKALQWCRDNPRQRKTAKGMPRFLNSWLSRAQNSPGRFRRRDPPDEQAAAPKPVDIDRLRAERQKHQAEKEAANGVLIRNILHGGNPDNGNASAG